MTWNSIADLGGVTGTGSATRVAFWNGTSSISSNANLYWDNTNSRLGIGTATPSTTLDVAGSTTLGGTGSIAGNVTGTGSPTISGFGTINGATISGGTLSGGTVSGGSVSGGSLTGGTYTNTGLTVSGNYLATIGNTGNFALQDSASNTLLTITDDGSTGTLSVNTISASNIGGYTLTGNIVGSGSPTLSGLGTINGATISGGTLSGGSVSGGTITGGSVSGGTLSGGTYTNTGATVTGSYAIQIGDTGSLTITDGTNTIFSLADAGTTGNLSGLNNLTASGTINFADLGGVFSGSRVILTDATGTLSSLSDGTSNQILSTNGSGTVSWNGIADLGGVTGTGAATRVAFWSGTSALSSNANLYWDNTNSRLGIGTATPGTTLDVAGSTTLGGAVSISGNITGSGSNTLSNFGTINGATISGGTLSGGTVSGGTLSGGTYTSTGATVAGNFTTTIGDGSSYFINDALANTLLSLVDNGSTATLNVNTLAASNIGPFTLTGNITGSGSPTLSGFGTINGATISGGTLSGGSVTGGSISAGTISGSTLSGGTYSNTGLIVSGSYSARIADAGAFTITDGTNTLFSLSDGGAAGNLSNLANLTATGDITFGSLGGSFSGSRLTLTDTDGLLSSLADGGSNTILRTDGSGNLSWVTVASLGGVTGTGTANRVTFWTGTSAVSSSANLYWDNSNNRLGINNATPSYSLDVNGTTNLAGAVSIGGNITSSGSPTLSGFGTINGATISGGTLSGGSLTGGTYSATGVTVAGNYQAQTGDAGTFTISDGTNTLATFTDDGTRANLAGLEDLSAAGQISFGTLGGVFSGNRVILGDNAGVISLLVDGSTNQVLTTNGSGSVTWTSLNTLGGVTGTGTATGIAFWDTTNSIASNSDLYWDNTNNRLGVGTDTPSTALHIAGNSTLGGTVSISGNVTGTGSPTLSGFGTINGATISGGTLSGGSYTAAGLSVAADYTVAIGNVGSNTFTVTDGTNTLLSLLDNGTLSINTISATNIGAFNLTGNLTGTGSPTLSGLGTINGATISGGTLSGGNYTATINAGGNFNIYDGTQNIFTLTDAGAVGDLSNLGAITANGTITFSGLSTGIVKSNSSGALSSAAINLASADVTGVLDETNGGTGQSTFAASNILYASSANTLTKLPIGSNNQVLAIASGTPTWANVSGASCTNCLLNDPSSTQVITPTSSTATGLSIAQSSGGSVDIFNVTNNGGSAEYFQIDSSGNVVASNFTVDRSGDHIFKIDLGTASSTRYDALLSSVDLTNNRTYTFPDESGTFCLTSGNCSGAGGGVTTTGGTTNRIPKFTAAQNLEDSTITDSGSLISFGSDLSITASTPTFDFNDGATFAFRDGTNTLFSIADNGTTGTATVHTIAATNIGAFTLTGNITGSGTPTLSGFGTINGATLSGGTLSGGSVSGGTFTGGSVSGGTLSGGTYSNTSATVTGSYTFNIGDGGTFSISDGTNTLATFTDDGTAADLSGMDDLTAAGTITFSDIGGVFSNNRLVTTTPAGALTSIANGSNGQVLSTSGSGDLAWITPASGTVTGSGTATRIAFWDGASSLSSNANLYWDDTNGRLGLGTASPSTTLHVSGSSTLAGTVAISGNVTGTGSPTLSGFGTINGATLSGGTLSGGVYSDSGLTASANYTATIGNAGNFSIRDSATNALPTVTDNGTTGTLAVNTLAATNIGAFTATGNIVGSGSPTISGFGTINGATLSGGTLSGGTFSGGSVTGGSLSGGTYRASGLTATGAYTATIGNGTSFSVSDGSNTLLSLSDTGSAGTLNRRHLISFKHWWI